MWANIRIFCFILHTFIRNRHTYSWRFQLTAPLLIFSRKLLIYCHVNSTQTALFKSKRIVSPQSLLTSHPKRFASPLAAGGVLGICPGGQMSTSAPVGTRVGGLTFYLLILGRGSVSRKNYPFSGVKNTESISMQSHADREVLEAVLPYMVDDSPDWLGFERFENL